MTSNAAQYPPNGHVQYPPSHAGFPPPSSSFQQFSTGAQKSFLHGSGHRMGPQRSGHADESSRPLVTNGTSSSGSLAYRREGGSLGTSEGSSPESNGGSKGKTARFGGSNPNKNDYQEERSKILTMKYGKQQMMLIRKRLKVEMWLMDELEGLFEDEDLAAKCDMDIDILLDLDTDAERRQEIMQKLTTNNCPGSHKEIEVFIKEFLGKLSTL